MDPADYPRWQRRQRRLRFKARVLRRVTPAPLRRRQHQRMLERCELINLRLEVVYLSTLVAFARRDR